MESVLTDFQIFVRVGKHDGFDAYIVLEAVIAYLPHLGRHGVNLRDLVGGTENQLRSVFREKRSVNCREVFAGRTALDAFEPRYARHKVGKTARRKAVGHHKPRYAASLKGLLPQCRHACGQLYFLNFAIFERAFSYFVQSAVRCKRHDGNVVVRASRNRLAPIKRIVAYFNETRGESYGGKLVAIVEQRVRRIGEAAAYRRQLEIRRSSLLELYCGENLTVPEAADSESLRFFGDCYRAGLLLRAEHKHLSACRIQRSVVRGEVKTSLLHVYAFYRGAVASVVFAETHDGVGIA